MTQPEDDEIVQEFLVESHENLDQLDRDLVALEQEPGSHDLLSSVFRTIHTIKGTSGFLAFGRLEALTHAGENLLSRLRDGELRMTAPIADGLLRMVDAVRLLLAVVESTGTDTGADLDLDGLVAVLADLAGAGGPAAVPAPTHQHEDEPEPPAPAPAGNLTVPTAAAPAGRADAPAEAAPRTASDSTVRVDVDLLDALVQLVGELVLVRNQILQHADASTSVELVRASQRLDLVASELQESVMKTRMQPIGQVWAKLPRVVRDLGAQLGKQVSLTMAGHDTELDRSLLEAVKDPITHLVRNSIDHGLESAEERQLAGKTADGNLSLRAYHESGQVIVEISDDGRGIDPANVGATAVRRGIVSQDALARMDAREITELIFRPGFSTAAAVTNVSGRGVGMDVVRTNIERIGGTVDLASNPGRGTTFRVRIPLTLAIIPALVVEEAGQRYAIPQANLLELVRLEGTDLDAVETIAGTPVLRLRGALLPLVSMAAALGLDEDGTDARTVVVVQADDVRFGLTVGRVHDTQEIVVKPLGRQLKALGLYAGATIMGDGQVALIVAVGGVAAAMGVDATPTAAAVEPAAVDADSTALLLLDVGDDRRAALSLAEVARLEEFRVDQIERSGPTEVVQYRDGILPLVRLAAQINITAEPDPTGILPVVVHGSGPNRVGIVVNRVLDVVETAIDSTPVGRRPGVLGSAVLQGRVTDLVDLDAVVSAARGRA